MDMFSQGWRAVLYFCIWYSNIYEGIPYIYLLLFLFLKVLAQNSGYDLQETLVKVQTEHSESKQLVGIDLNTGKKVKKQNKTTSCLIKRLYYSDPEPIVREWRFGWLEDLNFGCLWFTFELLKSTYSFI